MKKILYVCFLLSYPFSLLSLPIGFRVPQGDRDYNQTKNEHFYIYHDKMTPHEAQMILESLEKARPILNSWFKTKRSSVMPVISSAITSNASFANFFTDAIELQTLGQGHRDLFWHEYVHMMMYMHIKNFFGSAGTIFHIPWMPAWFLEGLAEALSMSIDAERQANIERHHALHDSWPSFDRLHSLYAESNFFERGYASSGAFVTWILRKGYEKNQDFLVDLLKRFYKYTLPLYYPFSATPFSKFLPMDNALLDFFGKNGRQLYAEYKEEARLHWEKHRGKSFLKENEEAKVFSSKPDIQVHGDRIHIYTQDKSLQTKRKQLRFSRKNFARKDSKHLETFPENVFSITYGGDYTLALEALPAFKTGLPRFRIVLLNQMEKTLLIEREGQISDLGESRHRVFWKESIYEKTRICYTLKMNLVHLNHPLNPKKVKCSLSLTLPKSLDIVGIENEDVEGKTYVQKIWYSIQEQTIKGDLYTLWSWDLDNDKIKGMQISPQNKIYSVAKTNSHYWVLVGERAHRTLIKVAKNSKCLGLLKVDDYIKSIYALEKDLILSISNLKGYYVKKEDPTQWTLEPCRDLSTHTSPLLIAMHSPEIDLKKALAKSSLWEEAKPFPTSKAKKTFGEDIPGKVLAKDEGAEWKARPVFALPWIGANDALGSQIGFLSIPLMDHMQNETINATFLYGLQSKYPNTEITATSTRYWPQLALSLYRRQLWNGRYRSENQELLNSFIDEKGLRLVNSIQGFLPGISMLLTTGFLYARRDPYIGPRTAGSEGHLLQPLGIFILRGRFASWAYSFSLDGSYTSESWNDNFDYNVLNTTLGISKSLPFLSSTLAFNLEGGRTRGKSGKTPVLQQFYTPLRTFLPGSASSDGYTRNSFSMFGQGRLLATEFGDTRAKAEINWYYPVIQDWDRLIWIMYFQELRFSTFFNYGGTWYHERERAWDRFLFAHAYSLDMFFENKGVRFNLGVGAGQVNVGAGQVFLNAGINLFF